MSKSCCFAVVLAVICLPVILLSLEADAQSTVDETMTCGASTLEEIVNMVKIVASNQQQKAMQEIKDEIRLLAANPIKIELDAGEPSKQAIISALVCEYLVCFFLPNKAHKRGYYIDITVLG